MGLSKETHAQTLEAVKNRETQRTEILNNPCSVLATATQTNETGCNMDDGGNIIPSATINKHHQEGGAGTDAGSMSLRHSLQTGAVALRFSPEYHDKGPVI